MSFVWVCVFFIIVPSLPSLALSLHPPTFFLTGQTRLAGPFLCIALSCYPPSFFFPSSPLRLDTRIVYLISVYMAGGATCNLSGFIPSACLGRERRRNKYNRCMCSQNGQTRNTNKILHTNSHTKLSECLQM